MSQRAATAGLFSIRRYGDIAMALGVIAVMALMVLRLPTALIDVLVAVNIACGVVLLLIALYVPHPVAFSSFPSVLLISTLFRLSLSVATTRLILLDAHAGHIIDAFGRFVAGGNLVVGIVVFIIITIVQFIVIAKGAERVAEVAARFTLDAMPGKQLSIDSDLRSGLIDKDEARRRRGRLERESQMHGALDGAMKFVKGDAIASIIIVIVNLLGGLTIGVMQRGLGAGEAMSLYSILTIGDGMVAQLPALMSAMAAGLVVTRSSGEDGEGHLGESIGKQVIAHPRALMMSGVVSLLLAAVPGFPALVFIGLAAVAFLLARYARSSNRDPHGADAAAEHARDYGSSDYGAGETGAVPVASTRADQSAFAHPLAIELSIRAWESTDVAGLRRAVAETSAARSGALGVRLPTPHLAFANHVPTWRILIYDVPVSTSDAAAAASIEELQRALDDALERHAERFVGVQEVSNLLDSAAEQYPALVKEALRLVPVLKVAEVLRNLLRESIPVRNLRDVLEALAEWGGREKEAGALTELVRVHLRRYMSSRFAGADRRIEALVIDGGAEEIVRRALAETPAGVMLALPPQKVAELRASLNAELERIGTSKDGAARNPVLITSVDIRRHIRQVLEPVRPGLQVISWQELQADVQIQPLGSVHFHPEAS
jgi:type III secretion protein V